MSLFVAMQAGESGPVRGTSPRQPIPPASWPLLVKDQTKPSRAVLIQTDCENLIYAEDSVIETNKPAEQMAVNKDSLRSQRLKEKKEKVFEALRNRLIDIRNRADRDCKDFHPQGLNKEKTCLPSHYAGGEVSPQGIPSLPGNSLPDCPHQTPEVGVTSNIQWKASEVRRNANSGETLNHKPSFIDFVDVTHCRTSEARLYCYIDAPLFLGPPRPPFEAWIDHNLLNTIRSWCVTPANLTIQSASSQSRWQVHREVICLHSKRFAGQQQHQQQDSVMPFPLDLDDGCIQAAISYWYSLGYAVPNSTGFEDPRVLEYWGAKNPAIFHLNVLSIAMCFEDAGLAKEALWKLREHFAKNDDVVLKNWIELKDCVYRIFHTRDPQKLPDELISIFRILLAAALKHQDSWKHRLVGAGNNDERFVGDFLKVSKLHEEMLKEKQGCGPQIGC